MQNRLMPDELNNCINCRIGTGAVPVTERHSNDVQGTTSSWQFSGWVCPTLGANRPVWYCRSLPNNTTTPFIYQPPQRAKACQNPEYVLFLTRGPCHLLVRLGPSQT